MSDGWHGQAPLASKLGRAITHGLSHCLKQWHTATPVGNRCHTKPMPSRVASRFQSRIFDGPCSAKSAGLRIDSRAK